MTSVGAFKILVLAHDLSDPAISRRVSMLKMGGATVKVGGFYRSATPIENVCDCTTVNFGRTHNGGFIKRCIAVLREILFLHRHRALFVDTDIILARNLEMLAIAVRGQRLTPMRPVIVYEVLDIHRLLLGKNSVGSLLRAFEGRLTRHASALLTSSPAFITYYFEQISNIKLPAHLVENKLLTMAQNLPTVGANQRQKAPPWRIGWYGIIRCKESLDILRDLVRQGDGKIEVVIRGRPALDQIEDFHERVADESGLRFDGPYKNPDDLAALYNNVHFTWTIDMYEAGQNSSWLLPNRLYEGGAFGAVPIAIDGLETSNFIKRLGIGVSLQHPLGATLVDFFSKLTLEKYFELESAVKNVPRSVWAHDDEDCQNLVDYLVELKQPARHANDDE